MVYKKSYHAAAATRRLIKNLTAPLPRWLSKKMFQISLPRLY
jgi:hypothetical protein